MTIDRYQRLRFPRKISIASLREGVGDLVGSLDSLGDLHSSRMSVGSGHLGDCQSLVMTNGAQKVYRTCEEVHRPSEEQKEAWPMQPVEGKHIAAALMHVRRRALHQEPCASPQSSDGTQRSLTVGSTGHSLDRH